MKRFLLILVCLIPAFGLAQWRRNELVEAGINDMTFTDQYNGYAVFASAAFGSCPSTHGLFKTIDGGENWIRMSTGFNFSLVAVHFVNQMTGWIAGTQSEIRKTTDGGATWVQQTTGVGSGYNDIYFKDLNTGFVTGNGGYLRRSINGGATWQTITSGVTATLGKIVFASPTLGFITCSGNQMLKTTNGGTSWTVVPLTAPGIRELFFTSATVGYAASGTGILKTTDAGTTWTMLNLGASNPTFRIYFPTANVGYVCVPAEGIYKTTDAGSSWVVSRTPNGASDSYSALHFADQNHGWIGGINGRITKTTDGGITWYNKTAGLSSELFTVKAPHKDTAYAGGREGHIFKTENGGTTFFEQARLVNGQSNSFIQKLFFLDPQRGFAVLDSGRIFKTTNGGDNWVQKPSNTLLGLTDIQFLDSNLGFACGGGIGAGVVLKSTDAGESWTSIGTGVNEAYTELFFINEDTGFVINNLKIQRTMNGGLTWTPYTPVGASNLNDIVFVNDSLGYCAGTFGKPLYTTNTGTTWLPTNNNPANAEIREMWFASANQAFVARSNGHQLSMDSLKTFTGISAACSAVATYNSISMTDGGLHGYCVGGLDGFIHQSGVPEIIRAYTSTNAYCPGASIFVAYHAKGWWGGGATYTAQLSDASGSFAAPTNIGSYTPAALIYQSGVITATLPIGANGSNYRIRVVSSNPVITSPDNGFPITISNSLQPTVTLQANPAGTVCAGTTITLSTSNFAGGLNPSYAWTVNGLPVANTASNFITNGLQNGDVVQVSMVSSLSCASATPVVSNTYTAVIGNLPLSLGNDTTVCQNASLQFAAPPGYTYSWSPTTGLSNATIGNPVATISSNVQYRLTITDAVGCTGRDTISITARPLPQFSLGPDTTVCAPDSIVLQGPSGYAYTWQPPVGLSNPSAQSPTAGIGNNVQYTLLATDTAGCVGRDSIAIIASSVPAFGLGADTVVCAPGSLVLPGPAGYVYNWLPTTGLSNPTAQSPTVSIGSNVQYALTVANAFGCTRSDTIAITAHPRPQFQLANDTTICAYAPLILQGPAGYAYNWLPPLGLSNPTAQSPTATVANNIQYVLTATDSAGCAGRDSIAIAVSSVAPFSLGADTIVCENDTVVLHGPAGYAYNWQPPLGLSNPSAQSPIATVSNSIQYLLTASDSVGCVASDSITIAVSSVAPVSLGRDTMVCVQDSIVLHGPAGYGYSWQPSIGLSNSTSQSPTAIIGSSIQYILTIADTVGCTGADSISLGALPLPQISLGADTALCQGDCAQIQGSYTGTAAQIVWLPTTSLSDSLIVNPIACPTATTNYAVTVTTTDQCSNSASIQITVHSLPAQPQITFNGVLLSTDPSVSYQWLFNGNIIPGANAITYQPAVSGNYAVIVTNSDGCTSQSLSFPVILNTIGGVNTQLSVVLYPNPAQDEVAVLLQGAVPASLRINVYESNGRLVFQGHFEGTDLIRIDLKAFAAGIYTLGLVSEAGMVQKRLVIVR